MAAIYLIRHGQASFGKRDYDALSDTGEEQSRVLGASLARRVAQPDRVLVGGMQRHRQTAQHVLTAMGLPVHYEQDVSWNEYDHQELMVRFRPSFRDQAVLMAELARSLKPRETFQRLFEQALARWVSGAHDADYAEPWPLFKERIAKGLEALKGYKGNTLVFTSGGAISASVRQLWELPDARWARLNHIIANATVTKIVSGRSGLTLSTFNEHGHFEGEYKHLLTYR